MDFKKNWGWVVGIIVLLVAGFYVLNIYNKSSSSQEALTEIAQQPSTGGCQSKKK